jgi:hypothetical protein
VNGKHGCSLPWLRLTRPDWNSELWRIVIRENVGIGPHPVMAASQTIGPSHMPSATGTTTGERHASGAQMSVFTAHVHREFATRKR